MKTNQINFTKPENTLIFSLLSTLNKTPAATGETAKALHALSQAIDALQAIEGQALAQFRAGDSHATFNKQTIQAIFNPE